MTAFVYSKFEGSEYVTYDGAFVARFKRGKKFSASFIEFLIDNFTVEEYFARLTAGEAPLTILRSAGYIHPSIARKLQRWAAGDTAL